MKPLLIASVLKSAASKLNAAGIDTPDLDARVILGHVLGMNWSELVLKADSSVDTASYTQLEQLIARRVCGEPVAYLIGAREFWGLEFEVDRSTLVPRPDSETLVEAVLSEFRNRNYSEEAAFRFLDLGTGSGCLLLALLSELPRVQGEGIDCCGDALDVARRNAERLGFQERVGFYESDWGKNIDGLFNIIVANPPYIATCDLTKLPRDVYQFEPHNALCGGPDGFDAYRQLAKDVPRLLWPGGLFVVEIGAGQAKSVRRILFDQSELKFLKSYPDLTGTIRVLVGQKRNIEKRVGIGSPTR